MLWLSLKTVYINVTFSDITQEVTELYEINQKKLICSELIFEGMMSSTCLKPDDLFSGRRLYTYVQVWHSTYLHAQIKQSA